MFKFIEWLKHIFSGEKDSALVTLVEKGIEFIEEAVSREPEFTGVLEDTRTEEEKNKDYLHIEVAIANTPVVWREKLPEEFRKFPIRNQDGSFSCFAQATAKAMGIEQKKESGVFMEFSAFDIYDRRVNKPQAGMAGNDALQICRKGVCFESELPSQNLSEVQMNQEVVRTPEILRTEEQFKALGYVSIANLDFDTIASIIDQGKAVVLCVFFKNDEWNDYPAVKYPNLGQNEGLRHAVVGTDITLHQGEKSIVIDDSWGKFYGLQGQRVLTESFLKQRMFYAGYLLDLKKEWKQEPIKPTAYHFSKMISENSVEFVGNNLDDVRALQEVLKYEQLFPQNIPSTGRYLQITEKAVLAFQLKYKVDDPAVLQKLGGKFVGQKTLIILNSLYGF